MREKGESEEKKRNTLRLSCSVLFHRGPVRPLGLHALTLSPPLSAKQNKAQGSGFQTVGSSYTHKTHHRRALWHTPPILWNQWCLPRSYLSFGFVQIHKFASPLLNYTNINPVTGHEIFTQQAIKQSMRTHKFLICCYISKISATFSGKKSQLSTVSLCMKHSSHRAALSTRPNSHKPLVAKSAQRKSRLCGILLK